MMATEESTREAILFCKVGETYNRLILLLMEAESLVEMMNTVVSREDNWRDVDRSTLDAISRARMHIQSDLRWITDSAVRRVVYREEGGRK